MTGGKATSSILTLLLPQWDILLHIKTYINTDIISPPPPPPPTHTHSIYTLMSVLTISSQSGVEEIYKEIENCHLEVHGDPGTQSTQPIKALDQSSQLFTV